MGRHTRSSPDSTATTFARPASARPTEFDIRDWLAERTPNQARALAAAVAVAATGLLGAGLATSGPSDYEIAQEGKTSARNAGAEYGAELRDEGYNSLTISARCEVNDDGYQGQYFEQYIDGCMSVVLHQMDKGL